MAAMCDPAYLHGGRLAWSKVQHGRSIDSRLHHHMPAFTVIIADSAISAAIVLSNNHVLQLSGHTLQSSWECTL